MADGDLFNFCPNSQVPITLAPDPVQGMTMNGWDFSVRPAVPYQRKFRVTLHGMKWYLDPVTGRYDKVTDPQHNAALLEDFYRSHGTWLPFYWEHPHIGRLAVRFAAKVDVPEGKIDSNGLIEKFEITFIHHSPGY